MKETDGYEGAHVVHTIAGEANAAEGHVIIDGPDGVAVTLTPEAAELMGVRMIVAAAEAKQQRRH